MLVIDSAKFIRDKTLLQGHLPVASLKRVIENLSSHKGNITYQVQGGIDKLSRPILTFELNGECEVMCQRCLTTMSYAVAVSTIITLFNSEEAIDAAEIEDPDIEGIIFTEQLDLAVLIEDELILALPYAPRHKECVPDKMAKIEKPNPFAALAVLKTQPAE